MSGTKQSWDFESIKKIFIKTGWWETHYIKPHLPYNDGVEVGNRGDYEKGIMPYPTQFYGKNWQLGAACLRPGYSPERNDDDIFIGLFDEEPQEAIQEHNIAASRIELNRMIDHMRVADFKLTNYGIGLPESILETLLKFKNKLK